MPLNEVEMGQIHRKVMLAMKRAREYMTARNLRYALREYAQSWGMLQVMFDCGLSDYFMTGQRFQQLLDLVYENRKNLEEVKLLLKSEDGWFYP